MKNLQTLLEGACSFESTWTPERNPGRHPTTGHCGNASLAVHRMTGMPIMSGWVIEPGQPAKLHYWNDATWAQFAPGAYIVGAAPIDAKDVTPDDWLRMQAALFLRRVQLLAGPTLTDAL